MAARRTDARQKMVLAARQRFRERGYHATALSDVLTLSEAPRGSVYFHFPGGKAQLAVEAAELHVREQVERIDRAAAAAGSPAGLVRAYLGMARENLVASAYREGCTLAPLVIESAGGSDELGDIGGRGFSAIIESLAAHFAAFGLDDAAARRLAHTTVAGMEGALVTSRALRSTEPFDALLAVLENQVALLDD
jgi:TetR/AcrR family transcriptional repressor of lmrAB and yxaGH operons